MSEYELARCCAELDRLRAEVKSLKEEKEATWLHTAEHMVERDKYNFALGKINDAEKEIDRLRAELAMWKPLSPEETVTWRWSAPNPIGDGNRSGCYEQGHAQEKYENR